MTQSETKPDRVTPTRIRLVIQLDIVPVDEHTEEADPDNELDPSEIEEFAQCAAEALIGFPYPEFTAGSGLFIGVVDSALVSVELALATEG